MLNKVCYILLFLLLMGCNSSEMNESFNALIKKKAYSAVMFIAPDCPLCMTMSKPYLDLQKQYPQVQFIVVHSGKHYEPMELNMFATNTGLRTIFKDRDYSVAHQFGATITPEFLLIDSSANVLYQGLLDDRMADIGVKKQTWSKSFLGEAIASVMDGKTVAIKRTEPIGCVLEY